MNPYATPKSNPEQTKRAKRPRGYKRHKNLVLLTPPLVILPRRCIYTNRDDDLQIYESLVKSKHERCYVNFCVDRQVFFRKRLMKTALGLGGALLACLSMFFFSTGLFGLIGAVWAALFVLNAWVILKSGPLVGGLPTLKRLPKVFLDGISDEEREKA